MSLEWVIATLVALSPFVLVIAYILFEPGGRNAGDR